MMTRKSALKQAISILSGISDTEEIISVLEEIMNEKRQVRWTKEAVINSVNTFIEDNNGFFPNTYDISHNSGILPAPHVITRILRLNTLEEIRREYFPNSIKKPIGYNNWSSKIEYMELFKKNYDRIGNGKYVTENQYNKYRDKGSLCSATITKRCGCSTYRELLYLCGYGEPIIAIGSVDRKRQTSDEINKELKAILRAIDKKNKHV